MKAEEIMVGMTKEEMKAIADVNNAQNILFNNMVNNYLADAYYLMKKEAKKGNYEVVIPIEKDCIKPFRAMLDILEAKKYKVEVIVPFTDTNSIAQWKISWKE